MVAAARGLGEARNTVTSGRLGEMRVRIESDENGTLWSIAPRPLQRAAGREPDFRRLPTSADVTEALDESQYDVSPWSAAARSGHRNRLEGWIDETSLHNLVHVWIGGDMGPATSPNDPAFFLNHCNVDRIWEAWMGANGRVYAPEGAEGPAGHRLDDQLLTLFGESRTPRQVLDPAPWYEYDSLT